MLGVVVLGSAVPVLGVMPTWGTGLVGLSLCSLSPAWGTVAVAEGWGLGTPRAAPARTPVSLGLRPHGRAQLQCPSPNHGAGAALWLLELLGQGLQPFVH